MTITNEQVEALYQANLNRPGDTAGIGYYLDLANTRGVTLSEIETMFKGSAEYAQVHAPAAPPPPPPPPPPAPPPVTTGGVTGTAPAPSPAPAPAAGTGGTTTDQAAVDEFPADQWVPWASNSTVKIGAGVVLALLLFSGSGKR